MEKKRKFGVKAALTTFHQGPTWKQVNPIDLGGPGEKSRYVVEPKVFAAMRASAEKESAAANSGGSSDTIIVDSPDDDVLSGFGGVSETHHPEDSDVGKKSDDRGYSKRQSAACPGGVSKVTGGDGGNFRKRPTPQDFLDKMAKKHAEGNAGSEAPSA